MKGALMLLGILLTGGTGVAAYLGNRLRKDKARAKKASLELRTETENARVRRRLRRDWANEHEVISDYNFVAFPHKTQTIGGIEVSCPKCKEL
jgi:hypothetical protein